MILNTAYGWTGVCPTYVGMNRGCWVPDESEHRMPHVCGDEPRRRFILFLHKKYAPRMWG